MMNKSILTVLFLFILVSCEKEGTGTFQDQAVVESYILPGQKINVKISKKLPYDSDADTSEVDVNDLVVEIHKDGSIYSLLPQGSGIYSDTAGLLDIEAGSSLELFVTYNNTLVSSSTVIPSKPAGVEQSETSISMEQIDPDDPMGSQPPSPVEISFDNDEEDYYLATVECIDSVKVSVYKDSIPETNLFSTRPTTQSTIDIQPMMLKYFGLNRIILYHINKEYTTFLNMQVNTSQNYQDPPTNIVNGLGIFTGMNTDTLYLQVNIAD